MENKNDFQVSKPNKEKWDGVVANLRGVCQVGLVVPDVFVPRGENQMEDVQAVPTKNDHNRRITVHDVANFITNQQKGK